MQVDLPLIRTFTHYRALLEMDTILLEPKPQEPAVDYPADQRINLEFRRIFHSSKLSSGRTFRVLFRSLKQKNSLLHRLASLPNSALIASDGGLISNLTVQENILLPVQYHATASDESALKNAIAILARFGFDQSEVFRILQSLPANLSVFERRLASFARIVVVEPEILVCDTVFEGLADDEVAAISRFSEFFHLYFPFRTVIFLELDLARGIIHADQTFYLQ